MDQVRYQESEGVLWVILNRPEVRNAFSPDMRREVRRLLLKADADPRIRCVAIRGSGGHFISGGDLQAFASLFDLPAHERYEGFYSRVEDLNKLILLMQKVSKPIVACVEGNVAGAGISLALACDLVVASETAKFSFSYSKVGVSPDGGLSYFLPRLIGRKKYMELVMLNGFLGAKQAERLGLVNFVFDCQSFEDNVSDILSNLCAGPTCSYGKAKELAYQAEVSDLPTQLSLEAQAFAACSVTNDFKEGVCAFLGKRKPEFSGK